MEYKPYIGFKGLYSDLPVDLCPDGGLISGSQNFRIVEGGLESKYGYEKMQSAVFEFIPLKFFKHYALDGALTFLCLTERDVMYWDNAAVKFKYLTPQYITGTASCAGTTAVTGASGAAWQTAVIAQYDEIGFNTQDPNAVVTWYTIASVGGETSITLDVNGPNTGGAVNYVIRKVYHASYNNRWSVCTFYDGSIGKNICVMTNGDDYPIYWTGTVTDKCADLAGNPPKAKYVAVFKSRLFFGNIGQVQTGKTGTALSYTIIWSPTADAETWTAAGGAGYQELYDTEGVIRWMIPFGEYLAIGKSDSIILIRATGLTSVPFEPYYVIKGKGSLLRIVDTIPGGLLFVSNDDIVIFDGSPALRSVADGKIRKTFFENLNLDYDFTVNSLYSPKYNEWHISVPGVGQTVPDRTWILMFKSGEWCCDNKGYTALDSYGQGKATLWSGLTQTWTQLATTGITWRMLDGATELENIILGSSSKYVYIERDYLGTEDGVDIAGAIITKDYILAGLDQDVRILDSFMHYKGTLNLIDIVSVYLSTDHGNTYTNPGYFNDSEPEERLKKKLSWNRAGRVARFRFTGRKFKIYGFEFGYVPQGVSR